VPAATIEPTGQHGRARMILVTQRPLLILDLDETLVWGTEAPPGTGFDFRAFRYFVTKRPNLDPFLSRTSAWFELAVWTSAGEEYAHRVVSEVFADPSTLAFAWSASRCTQRYDHETRKLYNVKDLKKVKRRGYALERVLVIDDSPEKLERNFGNHLRIAPFEGDPADRELLDLLPFLKWIKHQEDFRKIEKRNWRTWRL
jgi:RNA polymerase II subunit A small phosphatase-like protein